MTTYRPVYTVDVYDDDDTTILTPAAGAPHSDNCKVATASGIAGYQPYLESVSGRRGRIYPLTKRQDVGEMRVVLLDKRTATDNALRWVSAFLGNAADQPRLLNKLVRVKRRLTPTASFTSLFTGRIYSLDLDDPLLWGFVLRDLSLDLDVRAFVGVPHSSISYGFPAIVLPSTAFITGVGTYAGLSGPATSNGWNTGTSRGSGWFTGPNLFNIELDHFDLPQLTLLTAGLAEVLSDEAVKLGQTVLGVHLNQNPYLPVESPTSLRLRIKHTSGVSSGSTGTYRLLYVRVGTSGGETGRVLELACDVLRAPDGSADTGHSEYLAAPAAAVTVELYVQRIDRPTEAAPFFVDEQHPMAVLRDLVDGDFSLLDGGSPAFPITRDDATAQPGRGRGSVGFTAALADPSWGKGRWIITEPMDRRAIIENICQERQASYRFDGDGKFVLLDLRMPNDLTGLSTITDDDLVEGAPHGWRQNADSLVSEVRVQYYAERQTLQLGSGTAGLPAIIASPKVYGELDPVTFGDEHALEIDALGLRFLDTPFDQDKSQAREQVVQAQAAALINELRNPYSRGAMEAVLCTGFHAAHIEGDLVLVTSDFLPDPQTNQRGGTRVMRVLEANEEPDNGWIRYHLLDLGINAKGVAPNGGAMGQEAGNTKHGVTCGLTDVTDPARVEVAVTSTAVGTRPVENSELWRFAARVTSDTTVTVRELPSNSRIWMRFRAEPDGPSFPSDWSFPSGTGRVDTAAITAPSGLAVSNETATTAQLDWTNGDANYGIRVKLDGVVKAILIPVGTDGPGTAFTLQKLLASTTYNSPGAEVEHFDRYGGMSSSSSATVTTTATNPTAPDPGGPVQFLLGTPVGSAGSGDAIDLANRNLIQFGIAPRFVVSQRGKAFGIELQRATDTSGTGAKTVQTLPAGTGSYRDLRPAGSVWYYRWRHVRAGWDPGAWTSWSGAQAEPIPPEDKPVDPIIVNPRRVRVTHSTTQTVVPGSAYDLAFDTEDEDVGDFHTSSPNDRLTVPLGGSGVYSITVVVPITHGTWSPNHVIVFLLNKNGSTELGRGTTDTGKPDDTITITAYENLADGDFLEVNVTTPGGGSGSSTIASQVRFGISRVAPI